MKPLAFIVSPQDAGTRLDKFLAGKVAGVSRTRLKEMIDNGGAEVAGERAKPRRLLKAGERVVLTPPDDAPRLPLPEDIPLQVVYEDDDLLVVDKPAGLLVHPCRAGQGGTLVNALLRRSPALSHQGGEWRRGIVHRLDRDTSGLILAAKNDHAHAVLSGQFRKRKVEKEYRALVRGRPPLPFGRIAFPLGRSIAHPTRMMVKAEGGREAITEYEILEEFPEGSLLRVVIKTGRTHQIRVHLSRLGCPVLGDREYGRTGAVLSRRLGAGRQMLHAARIKFRHPTRGGWLEFESALPADMEAVRRKLKAGPRK
jgi:23S rRNA pseudouridine1911/1915/1917 synthase